MKKEILLTYKLKKSYKVIDSFKIDASLIFTSKKQKQQSYNYSPLHHDPHNIFDKINKTKTSIEIHLTDALSKLDSLYGVIFQGKSYYIGNRLEWLKTTIEYALDDEEFRDDLVRYMKTYI